MITSFREQSRQKSALHLGAKCIPLAMQSSQQSIMAFSRIMFNSFLRLNIWACWERYFSQEMGRSVGDSFGLRQDA